MRILHLDDHLEWRGGQRQMELWMGERPQDVWLVPEGSAAAARVPDLARPFSGVDLRRMMADYRADIVGCQTAGAVRWAAAAEVPFVVHRRVDFSPSWAASRRYRRALGIIAVSHNVARVVFRATGRRATVVYDATSPKALEAAPEGRLVAVGALVAHKDHRTLIDAIVSLPPGITCDIVGAGPLAAQLREHIGRRGLAGRVRLRGQLAPIPWSDYRCLVHPSSKDGFGQVVLEALSAGCQVVVSDGAGASEILVEPAGFRFRAGDAPDLAKALVAAFDVPCDPKRNAALAASFTPARMVHESVACYERWMSETSH